MAETFRAAWGFLELGGPIMAALAVISVVMWTLVFARGMLLLRERRALARGASGWRRRLESELAAVGAAGMVSLERRSRAVIDAMTQPMLRDISMIQILAGVAPLLGLLGTVGGMIETFEAIRLHGAADARELAAGIHMALVTTQAGLVVAVPGLVLGNLMRRRALGLIGRMERLAMGISREVAMGLRGGS
jgi:biopolymer transport protein ExbB